MIFPTPGTILFLVLLGNSNAQPRRWNSKLHTQPSRDAVRPPASGPLPPIAGAASRAALAAEEELDLYVRERFEDDGGGPCDGCRDGDGCYLRSRSFFLQGACVGRGAGKSSVYDQVAEGVVCRQDFRAACEEADGAATFAAATADDCRDAWTAGACAGSERLTRLEGWCAPSAAPAGERTVPLLTFRQYDDGGACSASDYRHLLLPDEGGACVALSYRDVDGTRVDGSRRGACDGGAFAATRYVTSDCTGASERTVLDGSSDRCPADAPGPVMYTEDCVAPKIHCKPSALFGAESATDSSKAVVSDGADASKAVVSDGSETMDELGKNATNCCAVRSSYVPEV